MQETTHRDVSISIPDGELHADFCAPTDGHGLVVFAHGSGSSRLSPRNRNVAERLNAAGFGTLLLDLLTAEEDQVFGKRFDIPLLGSRLETAMRWAKTAHVAEATPIALFGSSTGAAAALVAAASSGEQVAAVVSRGGRPDLAGGRWARSDARPC